MNNDWGVQPTNPETSTTAIPGPPPQPTASSGPLAEAAVATITEQPQQQTLPGMAPTPVPAPPIDDQQPSVALLLRDFTKTPGCDRYTSDGEKIKLLTDYLWCRQLVPTLPFATFLERYKEVADHDAENMKHPDAAMKHYLPRSKKKAEELGKPQWTAKQVAEFVLTYVDMIRAAEDEGVPIPMGFNDYIKHENIVSAYFNGEFDDIVKVPADTQNKKSSKRKKEKVVERPTTQGQRAIYTGPGHMAHRGHIEKIWTDEDSDCVFADFKSDAGELFQGVGITTLVACEDAKPNPPQDDEGDELSQIAAGKIRIKKGDGITTTNYLNSPAPLGNVALGDVLYSCNYSYSDTVKAVVEVVNGEPAPYVDAFLEVDGDAVCELEPRQGIEGTYTFTTPEGFYELDIKINT